MGSVLTVLGGQSICAAVSVATEICYARLLGPAGRGQVSLCMMAIAFGLLVGGLGGEGTIILWSSDPAKRSSAWLPAVLLWGFIGSCLASGLWVMAYWCWHPAFLHGITAALALLIAATIPPTVFASYLMAMLAGLERFDLRAGLSLVDQLSGLLGFIALIFFLGQTAEAAMLGNLFGLLLTAVVSMALLKNSFRGAWDIRSARGSFGPTLRFGTRGQLGLLATFFNYRLDVFIVNYFLNPRQVGFYALGVVISEGLWQIPSAAALALYPRTARTTEGGASEFTSLIMRHVFFIACVTGVAIAILSPLLVPVVFGYQFKVSVPVILLILPGTVALSLGKVACSDLAGRGKNGYSSMSALVALIVTVALDLVLIPRLGIRGAALSSSVSYFVNSALLLIALKRELKVSWRSLLILSYADLSSYQLAWLRCTEWFGSAVSQLSAGRSE